MTANGSSSSAREAPDGDLLAVDLAAGGRLPPLPSAFLEGRDQDLLSPVRHLAPGELPSGPPPGVDRRRLAEALRVANAGYGHPAAEAQARKLADPATRVVVTGQQPGLFGGPLLALSKMAAAVRWAEAIEAAGEPAVAVFWVATEDHDWAEMAHARVLSPEGAVDLELGDDPSPLTPVGMRTFGPAVVALHERLREAFPGDGSEAWLEPLARSYRPDARFGEAFCRLMVHLLGARAPLMLDSMLAELKQQQRPYLRRLVERRAELDRAFAAADAAIEERGYPLQVRPQPGLSPLFQLRGHERRRIDWRGDDRYGLRGDDDLEATISELLALLDDNPAAISPGVLARPAIQDAVLGTSVLVLGPAELSYLPQVAPVYELLGLEAPHATLRPQALVLDGRQVEHLEEMGVGLAEVLAPKADLDRLLADHLGEDFVTPARGELEAVMDRLREPVVVLDASLEKPWRKTREQVGRTLDQLASKVAAATARRHDVQRRRLERLSEACHPAGVFQERSLAVAHFLGRYGPGFGPSCLDQLGLDPRRLHVIRM